MKKRTRKVITLLFFILALAVVGIGVSRAYFSDQAKVEDNSFSTGT